MGDPAVAGGARAGGELIAILYQSERSECGLVSLAMLASAHGLQTDLASLRARYPISLKGSTLKDLVAVAADLKLETRAIRCDTEELGQLRLPAILHWRMDHFVVLVKCRGNKFTLHDPAIGKVVVGEKELSDNFTGVALEVWPGPKFQRRDTRQKLAMSAVIPRLPGFSSAIASLAVYALGIECIALVLPILQQFIIDDALVTGDTDLLSLIAIAIAVLLVGQAATAAIRGIVQRNLSSSLSLVVPGHVFRHMVALPASWFERRSAADVINRFESGNAIHRTLTTSIVSAGIDGLVAVIALAAMAFYNGLLASIVCAASMTGCGVGKSGSPISM